MIRACEWVLVVLVLVSCERMAEDEPAAEQQSQEAEAVSDREMRTLVRGDQCGVESFREVVVRDEEAWQDLWEEITRIQTPPDPRPEVDFSESLVIGVFLGAKSSSGYGVEIVELKEVEDTLRVYYETTEPDPGGIQLTVITHPHHLIRTARHPGPVQFEAR